MSGDALIWSVILGLGVATYAIRYSFIGLLGDRKLPPALAEALGFVPVTVLPALVAPAVFTGPEGGLALDVAQLAAAAGTVAVGILCRSLLPALLAGVALYFGLGWVF